MFTKKVLLAILAAGAVLLAAGIGSRFTGSAHALPPAQTGVTIPYSGRLADEAGGPVADGAYDFAFALYAAESGGDPLWTETQEGVAVQGGAFTVLLGRVAPLPQKVLAGGAGWLEVGVRGPGEAKFTLLSPRQELSVAAPVAPAGASAPTSGLSCAHTHWGETWTGTGSYGLKLNNTAGGNGGYALHAESSGANPAIYARKADSPNGAIMGQCTDGIGVYGYGAGDSIGVLGRSVSGSGLRGQSGSGYGVFGESDSGAGVYARGPNAVVGVSSTAGYAAVYGRNDAATGYGVYGESQNSSGHGVYGRNAATTGSAVGVYAVSMSSAGYALFAQNPPGGYAGYFSGKVHVTGYLQKSGGGFKVDHPLDPANKYLNHSFVESPDMKNVYDGVVMLDANGEAVVQLPAWFSALNRDFRYQLTCIGGYAPVYIADEIRDNQFKIAGGKPGLKVSWQVTGIRQDPWANAHRITVEEDKSPEERGTYLYPEGYGQPQEKSLDYQRNPELFRQPPEAPAPQGNQ